MRYLIVSFLFLCFPFFAKSQENPDKQTALIYYNIALSSDQMGNYERAIEYFLKAYELDTTYSDINNRIGNTYCKALSYKEALPYFEKHLTLFPNSTESYMNIGNTYYALDEYKKSITYYEKTIAIDSTHKTAYRNMGNAYYKLGNKEKQLEYFRKAAQLGDYEIRHWLRTNNEKW